MNPFKKICRLGIVPTRSGKQGMPVYVTITWDGAKLSIHGVEGPNHHGGAIGSCGQIDMHLRVAQFRSFAPGWDAAKVEELLRVWGRWHLNDMKAGTRAQTVSVEAFVRQCKEAGGGYPSYPEICAWLAEHALLWDWKEPKGHLYPPCAGSDGDMPEGAYKYGTAWLREDVPPDVLEWLAALPETDRPCPWPRG